MTQYEVITLTGGPQPIFDPQQSGSTLLCDWVGHVGLCVLNGDTELLCKLLEFLKVLASTSASGLVTLLEELGAVLGHGVHDFLEMLKLFHLCLKSQ